MFPKRSGVLLTLVALSACSGGSGGDPGTTPGDTPRAGTKVNHEPRVEGRWRVVYTPLSGEQAMRSTWTVKPACDEGACGFTIDSTGGAQHQFEYDEAIKDWTGTDRQRNPCVNQVTEEVVVKNGYRYRSQITLTPTKVVRTKTGTFVTEMFGERRDRSIPTSAAQQAECDTTTTYQDSVRAVRFDAPAGKPKRVDGTGYGE